MNTNFDQDFQSLATNRTFTVQKSIKDIFSKESIPTIVSIAGVIVLLLIIVLIFRTRAKRPLIIRLLPGMLLDERNVSVNSKTYPAIAVYVFNRSKSAITIEEPYIVPDKSVDRGKAYARNNIFTYSFPQTIMPGKGFVFKMEVNSSSAPLFIEAAHGNDAFLIAIDSDLGKTMYSNPLLLKVVENLGNK